MKKITILALLLTWGTATWAEENENQKTEEHKQVEESKRTSWNKYLHGYQYQARVAYNIGGTAPIGLPATIRTLHSYTLQPQSGYRRLSPTFRQMGIRWRSAL